MSGCSVPIMICKASEPIDGFIGVSCLKATRGSQGEAKIFRIRTVGEVTACYPRPSPEGLDHLIAPESSVVARLDSIHVGRTILVDRSLSRRRSLGLVEVILQSFSCST
jgi:hypothetical protein